ncbi:MAG: glycerophosphodiester phosphodiesterase [Verrucomicrobia bacterium]|nr:glycerophosphodiester phosphodiesterase [Verrucomicrobiota bacterium]MCH8512078.1 glycerophosphodiester phosphodiesterase [Kiritimatiellia bacterium]
MNLLPPLIVAHRGASAYAPENTLPAFRLAWEQGADAIEGDFQLTRDGHIVCIHDVNTKRVATQNLAVATSSLVELQALDVGAWKGEAFAGTRIPTLQEVMSTVPEGKKFFIEIKSDAAIVPILAEIIRESALSEDQIRIISFHPEVIQAVKHAMPDIPAFWISHIRSHPPGHLNPTPDQVLEILAETGADGFSSGKVHITPAFIRRIIDAGYEYHVWTVNHVRTARRFHRAGAASITTDRPGAIKRAF